MGRHRRWQADGYSVDSRRVLIYDRRPSPARSSCFTHGITPNRQTNAWSDHASARSLETTSGDNRTKGAALHWQSPGKVR